MYLAAMQEQDAPALARCLSALNAWGGQFLPEKETEYSKQLLHTVHCISSQWRHNQLAIVLSYSNYRFPLTYSELGGISLGAKFSYPIHAALISLRLRMHSAFSNKDNSGFSSSTGQDIEK
jgi:hypothetical protein